MTTSSRSGGFRFTLGEFLAGTTAIGAACASYYEAGLWGVGVIAGIAGGAAIVRGRRSTRRWLVAIGGLSVLVALGALSLALLAWGGFGVGPVFRLESFPGETRGMMRSAQVAANDVRVHGLGSFIDSEYVWRMRISGEQFERLEREYDLAPVEGGRAPEEFWRAFPWWWRPSRAVEPRVVMRATSDFPVAGQGKRGNHFFTLYDPANRLFYVWYKSHSF